MKTKIQVLKKQLTCACNKNCNGCDNPIIYQLFDCKEQFDKAYIEALCKLSQEFYEFKKEILFQVINKNLYKKVKYFFNKTLSDIAWYYFSYSVKVDDENNPPEIVDKGGLIMDIILQRFKNSTPYTIRFTLGEIQKTI